MPAGAHGDLRARGQPLLETDRRLSSTLEANALLLQILGAATELVHAEMA